MRTLRLLSTIAIAGLTTTSLASCIFLGSAVTELGQNRPVNDRPVADGPDGWQEFPSCEGGPRDDYIWVDGFPNVELTASDIDPDCGDTWIEADGDSFINVTDYSLTEAQIVAVTSELVAAGWEVKWDDFTPVSSASAPRLGVGARDFYQDNDQRKVAIEIYHNGTDPISYTAYIDYYAPETRQLTR